MPFVLLVLFIAVPLAELWVILQVGSVIGAGWTILLLVLDSLVGAWLVQREGRRSWGALREAFSSGRWPADELAQGALVVFGGALLLTPGFITDAIGLAAVVPPTRALLARLLRRAAGIVAARRMGMGTAGATIFTRPGDHSRRTRRDPIRGTTSRRAGRASPDVEIISVEREDGDGDRRSGGPDGEDADRTG